MFGKNSCNLPNIGKIPRRADLAFCQTLAKSLQICQTLAKPEKRAGFTLVEMLVACALLAFTGLAVASALFAVTRANELAAARAARPLEVLPLLAADAESAFAPSGLAEGEVAMALTHGDGDPLSASFSWHLFATDAAGGDGIPGGYGAAEVAWSLGRERAGEPAELVRVSAAGNAEPVTNRLLAGEWKLQAVAVGEDGREWTEWPPPGKEGEDPPALPQAIRFALSGEGFSETRLATVFAASAVAKPSVR